MTETGELSLRNILSVLRKHQVTISAEENEYTFAKGDRVETFKLGDEVSRHMTQKIARTFKVPIHEFYGYIVTAPTRIDAVKIDQAKKKPA
jgi:hypothetical protein